jgi:pimeloyl-ACP methyl ester carboxylesterase
MQEALAANYESTSEGINARLLEGAADDVRALVARDAAGIGREAGLRIIAASFDHDPIPALARYPGPKLAITTPDADTPNDLQNLANGVERQVIAGTSHWMQLDRPEEFNRILDAFLARIGEAP